MGDLADSKVDQESVKTLKDEFLKHRLSAGKDSATASVSKPEEPALPVIRPDYYVEPNPYVKAVIGYGCFLLIAARFFPLWIPMWIPLGRLARIMAEDNSFLIHCLFVFLVVAHLFEAVLAVFLCKRLGLDSNTRMRWALSTLKYGIASLNSVLKAHREFTPYTTEDE